MQNQIGEEERMTTTLRKPKKRGHITIVAHNYKTTIMSLRIRKMAL